MTAAVNEGWQATYFRVVSSKGGVQLGVEVVMKAIKAKSIKPVKEVPEIFNNESESDEEDESSESSDYAAKSSSYRQ